MGPMDPILYPRGCQLRIRMNISLDSAPASQRGPWRAPSRSSCWKPGSRRLSPTLWLLGCHVPALCFLGPWATWQPVEQVKSSPEAGPLCRPQSPCHGILICGDDCVTTRLSPCHTGPREHQSQEEKGEEDEGKAWGAFTVFLRGSQAGHRTQMRTGEFE